MISATQVRKNMVVIYNGQPHKVMDFRFTMHGRQGNTIQAKLRNILTGSQAEVRYRSDDKVEMTEIEEKELEYLYQDGDNYWFMDSVNYEQIAVSSEQLGDASGYLLPNSTCRIQLYESKSIGVKMPASVQIKVTETEPVIKGATASGNVTKSALLETGLSVQVPMFVDCGDIVIINTDTGEYQGRPGRR